MDESDLTPEEKRAVRTLKSLAKRWPKSLWVFANGGALAVLRCGPDGVRKMDFKGCVDAETVVATVDIPNDGGDW